MGRENRIRIFNEISEKRKSFVLSYITSTRSNLEVQMAMDSIRYVFEHIQQSKTADPKDSLDLILYSNGGDGTVPWRLVTLIKEYFQKFSVLIPYKAFSAATLTALGADEIIMHPMGTLGPTDPTVANAFNPDDPNPISQGRKLGISVEDVTAYINLVKDDVGLTHEDELVQAFNKLPEKVHPLALGNVKRSLSQSRMMARKLLQLHLSDVDNNHTISKIVDNLTSKLFFHGHPINRTEACELGITTICNNTGTVEIENLIWQLYLDYEDEMKLNIPFNPLTEFMQLFPDLQQGKPCVTDLLVNKLVFIESIYDCDVLKYKYKIIGALQPPAAIQTQLNQFGQDWDKE